MLCSWARADAKHSSSSQGTGLKQTGAEESITERGAEHTGAEQHPNKIAAEQTTAEQRIDRTGAEHTHRSGVKAAASQLNRREQRLRQRKLQPTRMQKSMQPCTAEQRLDKERSGAQTGGT